MVNGDVLKSRRKLQDSCQLTWTLKLMTRIRQSGSCLLPDCCRTYRLCSLAHPHRIVISQTEFLTEFRNVPSIPESRQIRILDCSCLSSELSAGCEVAQQQQEDHHGRLRQSLVSQQLRAMMKHNFSQCFHHGWP